MRHDRWRQVAWGLVWWQGTWISNLQPCSLIIQWRWCTACNVTVTNIDSSLIQSFSWKLPQFKYWEIVVMKDWQLRLIIPVFLKKAEHISPPVTGLARALPAPWRSPRSASSRRPCTPNTIQYSTVQYSTVQYSTCTPPPPATTSWCRRSGGTPRAAAAKEVKR